MGSNSTRIGRGVQGTSFALDTRFLPMGRITLTIDNGPDPHETPLILDMLHHRQIPAHFFVVGMQAAHPDGLALLERITDEGHVVGNHTWSHRTPFGENVYPSAVSEEVQRTADLLAPTVAHRHCFDLSVAVGAWTGACSPVH
ncbi:MAG: polysaccharide deacetylase family protein [Pseudomonadales bacterium]|nr:polysaccharide deacetylase family protein [Pseudomonadales bacterium]MDP6472773.1 polysaccharide deacetylase family protein [Pseudomonadales bacterium]MDP6827986.1 polysaccharide deacetylase family protein [Pseudomonadales bacterium]MDP6972885.1 polysaccharide deacetylase family protein [Pseudomonadales bacterium]